MVYKVLDVSRYIINYGRDNNCNVSNLKLQKLLYFVQAEFLVSENRPCFEEKIEAWAFGPVVPKAYFEYMNNAGLEIPKITKFYEVTSNFEVKECIFDETIIAEKDRESIRKVMDYFKDWSAWAMSELTHQQAPWKDVYEVNKKNEITLEAIKGFFV